MLTVPKTDPTNFAARPTVLPIYLPIAGVAVSPTVGTLSVSVLRDKASCDEVTIAQPSKNRTSAASNGKLTHKTRLSATIKSIRRDTAGINGRTSHFHGFARGLF